MTSISHLPTEVLLQIIEESVLDIKHLPIIGSNACWRPTPTFLRHRGPLPNPDYYKEFPVLGESKKEPVEVYKSPVKALRLTNKQFNALANPYLFRDLNMLYNWAALSIESIEKHRIVPHWQYIQVLRINVDEGRSRTIFGDSHTEDVAQVISTCMNLKSLGLYHTEWDTNFAPINRATMKLLEANKLDTIGIYNGPVLNDMWVYSMFRPKDNGVVGPTEILHWIAASKKASKALKKLDIATQWMSKETYALLQSWPFPSLESLTVRFSFRWEELWVADPMERNKWRPSTHLVRLQLLNCQTVYSPEISLMVQQFENLEELLVSTCGYRQDAIPPRRSPGWSHEPSALCQNRRPLRVFSIEHMSEWEILAFGTIPTLTLVSANVKREDLLGALELDSELFPRMTLLRVLPDRMMRMEDTLSSSEEEDDDDDDDEEHIVAYIEEKKKRLEAVCAKRRVELRRDAVRMRPCYCCGGY